MDDFSKMDTTDISDWLAMATEEMLRIYDKASDGTYDGLIGKSAYALFLSASPFRSEGVKQES